MSVPNEPAQDSDPGTGEDDSRENPPAPPPDAESRRDRRWKNMQGLLAILCLGAMFPLCMVAGTTLKMWVWLANMGLATAFLAFAGKATTRDWRGALIDDTNRLSLSRLQIALWTILIGSAYITAATTNAMSGEDSTGPTRQQIADAVRDVEIARKKVAEVSSQLKEAGGAPKQSELAAQLKASNEDLLKKEETAKELQDARRPGSSVIAIPTAVWLLLGISLTSLAGSPLVLSYKKERAPNQEELNKTLHTLKEQNIDPSNLVTEGQVVAKKSPGEATIADLFRGEETGNAAYLDLGRVQLFFFTCGVLISYAIALGARFGSALPIHEFPDLDTSIATLLGISNAGYLVNKSVPHSAPRQPTEVKK